jgi:DNA-directed RNA polymerase alpha subunit
MGIFLASENVKCRNKTGEEKVKVSISSEAAAKTLPDLASSAHCASASQGA